MNGRAALYLRVGLATLTLVTSMVFAAIAASPAAAASSAWFSSPSRNIGCQMDASGVRCDVVKYTYKPTKKPASCAFAWGPSVVVGTSGKGHFRCVSDTVAGSPKILRYGTSRIIGRFKCVSRTTGMTCVDLRNGHGFRIAKSSYRLF